MKKHLNNFPEHSISIEPRTPRKGFHRSSADWNC